MSLLSLTILVVVILFFATLINSAIGFGYALIAMPLLTLFISPRVAAPLMALVGFGIGVIIIGGNWRSIDLKSIWRLILAAAIGIPFGLLILTNAPETLVKNILGVLIIIFGLYSVTRPSLPHVKQQNWSYPFGFISGFFSGAYSIGGPPIVLYGGLRRWTPAQFRATAQGYFAALGLIVMVGHGLAGLWTPQVMWLFAACLPGVIIATLLGGKLNQRLPAEQFTKLLYVALIGLGVLLLV